MANSSVRRLPWPAYYCSVHAQQLTPEIITLSGLVVCPDCSQHFDNIQFMRHTISHLLINELHAGTLMSHRFCTECLNIPDQMTLIDHHKIHRHVENLDPLALLDSKFVCPICESSFSSIIKFAAHLYERHVYQDSPYICTICYTFRSSYYCELLSHFQSNHQGTNHLFCPYCLKYFELPLQITPSKDTIIFDAHDFRNHIHQHWLQTTQRCESCRLDFICRKDHKMHSYLNHTGNPCKSVCNIKLHESADIPPNPHNDQLCLYYSGQLTTQTPRLFLRCLECKERLRQPISKHFNLMINCAHCKYKSSCNLAVNLHWNIHSGPPIRNPFSDLKTGQTYVSALSGKNIDSKIHAISTYDSYGLRKSKERHKPSELFHRGILKCTCGFRTIVCDQMARHLVIEGHSTAIQDFSPRLSIFSIKVRKSRTLRTSLWWAQKLAKSPIILESVGLSTI